MTANKSDIKINIFERFNYGTVETFLSYHENKVGEGVGNEGAENLGLLLTMFTS